jgi:hypothetical protein
MVAAYTYLSQKYVNLTVGLPHNANKQTGFVLSKDGVPDRMTLARVCASTSEENTYPYPVINPRDQAFSCDASAYADGLVADQVLDITDGKETVFRN